MNSYSYTVRGRVKAWAWRNLQPNDTEINLRLRDRHNNEITLSGYVDDLSRLLEEWRYRLLELEKEILAETAMVEFDGRPGVPGRSGVE